ncbi:MAG: cation-translocating P-type ATPase [Lachnospiraceae bacterium]|nr:cation-translocating P-type ATPase [Lachnospiraceae bacterium]
MKYYCEEADAVLKELQSSPQGLSEAEAAERLEKYGKNKLEEAKGKSLIQRFFEQLADPMIIILIVAAVVSGVLAVVENDSFADVIIIVAVVLVNAILGVYQENKAEKAIEALQEMSAATSKVLRGGKKMTVPGTDLVPGDIVLLEAGDAVPADARILECASLKAEEAALTGESVPVTKWMDIMNLKDSNTDVPLGDRKNMVYMGSTIVYGRGTAVVTGTGMNTEMGKIADALQKAEDEDTPLQRKLNELSKVLTWLVLGICVVIFAVQLIREGNLNVDVILDSFMIAVSLAVAAIPEGLAAVVTVVLSIGVTNMSKRNAIIRKLTAVETLGCAQIICSDKTGTLTQNKMTVVDTYCSTDVRSATAKAAGPAAGMTGQSRLSVEAISEKNAVAGIARAETAGDADGRRKNEERIAMAMALCSDAELNSDGTINGEPTEAALVAYADKIGLKKPELKEDYPRCGEAPFDSERKMMSTVHIVKDVDMWPGEIQDAGRAENEERSIDAGAGKRRVSGGGKRTATAEMSAGENESAARMTGNKVLRVQFTKGGPDVVLDKCTGFLKDGQIVPMTDADRKEILAANKAMADRALRVLACAERMWETEPESYESGYLEQDLCFLGLCGMIDPVRPEVKAAIEECRDAGIRPIMITGDHIDTASAIARELGILGGGQTAERDAKGAGQYAQNFEAKAAGTPGDGFEDRNTYRAITGAELDRMSDEEFEKEFRNISVYARVQPEHKTRIVNAWRGAGYVTAMTGDGVNDAPSIKAADIGVGMGITGTDVTKNVADMVLADDNFATIVGAVEEGRRIYDNIRKAIQFLLGSNLSEVMSIFFATLMGFTILKPVHLLWINLVTDCFPALALGTEKAEPGIMKRKPRDAKAGIFADGMGVDVLYQGVMVTVLVLASYFIGHYMESGVWEIADSADGTTMAFLTMSMAEIFHSFNMRSQRCSIFKLGSQNKFLLGAAVGSLIATTLVCEVPFLANAFDFASVELSEYLVAIGLGLLVIPIVELVKFVQRKMKKA